MQLVMQIFKEDKFKLFSIILLKLLYFFLSWRTKAFLTVMQLYD